MANYAAKAFGPGAGFVIGWLYWISGILVMSSEATAAGIFSAVWFPGIPLWTFMLIYSVILTAINLSDPRGFEKLESFAIPDQRASFILGLSLIVITAGVYFILRHSLKSQFQLPANILAQDQSKHLQLIPFIP